LQGYLEISNVNVVAEVTNLISAQRAYEMNSQVIQTSDNMMSTTVNKKSKAPRSMIRREALIPRTAPPRTWETEGFMKRFALAFGLFLTAFPAIAADILPPALLRMPVRISEDSVHLGDLFDNAGPHAEQVVAAAPAFGRRLVLDTVWLYKVARAYGVSWQPASRKERAIVERLGQTLPEETLKKAMQEALAARGVTAESSVIFSNRTPPPWSFRLQRTLMSRSRI